PEAKRQARGIVLVVGEGAWKRLDRVAVGIAPGRYQSVVLIAALGGLAQPDDLVPTVNHAKPAVVAGRFCERAVLVWCEVRRVEYVLTSPVVTRQEHVGVLVVVDFSAPNGVD